MCAAARFPSSGPTSAASSLDRAVDHWGARQFSSPWNAREAASGDLRHRAPAGATAWVCVSGAPWAARAPDKMRAQFWLPTSQVHELNACIRLAVGWLLLPGSLAAQGLLDQFSYEGLRFSGLGFEFGAIVSDRLTTEPTGAVRIDYGYIAPKVRVLIGGAYFKGAFDDGEIARFENRLRQVVTDPTGDFDIDVGTITWADFDGSLDLQYLFRPEARVIPYVGLGLGVHVRDGDGAAIEGTFVEDALDTIAAGATISLGAEFVLSPAVRFSADLRGELTSELRTVSVRGGLMYRIPDRGNR